MIAVLGGLYRLEGAWIGALLFVIVNNYSQRIGFIGDRFHTLIGAIFLAIVLVSPSGVIGLWERALSLFSGRRRGPLDRNPIEGSSQSSTIVSAPKATENCFYQACRITSSPTESMTSSHSCAPCSGSKKKDRPSRYRTRRTVFYRLISLMVCGPRL